MHARRPQAAPLHRRFRRAAVELVHTGGPRRPQEFTLVGSAYMFQNRQPMAVMFHVRPKFQQFKSIPRTSEAFCRHTRFREAAILPARPRQRRKIMMHPHLPGPRPSAVPGIGFPQNISIDSEVLIRRPSEICWISTVVPQSHRSPHRLAPITTAMVCGPIVRLLAAAPNSERFRSAPRTG